MRRHMRRRCAPGARGRRGRGESRSRSPTMTSIWTAAVPTASLSATGPTRLFEPWLTSIVSERCPTPGGPRGESMRRGSRSGAVGLPDPRCSTTRRAGSGRGTARSRRPDRKEAQTAEQGLPPAVPAPDVREHRREEQGREELGREGQAEHCEGRPPAFVQEQGERPHGQRRRPQVEARQDDGTERERTEAREPDRGRQRHPRRPSRTRISVTAATASIPQSPISVSNTRV